MKVTVCSFIIPKTRNRKIPFFDTFVVSLTLPSSSVRTSEDFKNSETAHKRGVPMFATEVTDLYYRGNKK